MTTHKSRPIGRINAFAWAGLVDRAKGEA